MISGARDLRHCIKGGIVAGIVGGLVVALLMLLANVIMRENAWTVFGLAAKPILGKSALEPGFHALPVIVGVVSHFAVSIAWAIPFALIAYGLMRNETVLAGALWGIVVWLVMFYIVLPLVGLRDVVRTTAVMAALLEHMLFGIALGLGFLPYQRPEVRAGHFG